MFSLSPFFVNAFSGPADESPKRELCVQDVSVEAVSVFLDSAYCLDVGDALKENITLACELLTLAPRFGVSSLLHTIASVITSRLSVDSSCIQVY